MLNTSCPALGGFNFITAFQTHADFIVLDAGWGPYSHFVFLQMQHKAAWTTLLFKPTVFVRKRRPVTCALPSSPNPPVFCHHVYDPQLKSISQKGSVWTLVHALVPFPNTKAHINSLMCCYGWRLPSSSALNVCQNCCCLLFFGKLHHSTTNLPSCVGVLSGEHTDMQCMCFCSSFNQKSCTWQILCSTLLISFCR